ncbi:MAG: FtsW/RodA/SpoVE family cell cycle protein [Aerococcus sp.]|nr:FtsW/RodA/SpoVE family cell cycle protein [Aerococcus sp.]
MPKKKASKPKHVSKKKPAKHAKTPGFGYQFGRTFHYLNLRIFIPSLVLMIIGIVMVFTASSYMASIQANGNIAYYAIRQSLYVLIGVVLMIAISGIKRKVITGKGFRTSAIIVLVVALLVARFLMPPVNGAHGWINLGIISIQPVEFVKPAIVIFFANYIQQHLRQINHQGFIHTMIDDWQFPFLLVAFLGLAIMMPDFGGAFILLSIFTMMVLASGINKHYTFRLVGISVVGYAALFLIMRVFDMSWLNQWHYGFRRLTAFVNPFLDERGSGLQLANSYYALAGGGFFGRGPGASIEKTGYLPEAHNDFIMAIIGEEFGWIGISIILLLYFFLVVYIFKKALNMRRTYSQLVLVGVGGYLLIQAIVNLGAVTGLLPITGVTFPFISYGGSSIMVTSIMIGLALNVMREEQIETEKGVFDRKKKKVKKA